MPAALLALADDSPDREVCGVIIDGPGQLLRLHPMTNAAVEPAHAFLFEPQEMAALLLNLAPGEQIWAVYHSHPRGPALPSAADRRGIHGLAPRMVIISPQRRDVQVFEA